MGIFTKDKWGKEKKEKKTTYAEVSNNLHIEAVTNFYGQSSIKMPKLSRQNILKLVFTL